MSKQKPMMKSMTYHSWSPDRSKVAISPNNNEVLVYETGGKSNMADWGEPSKTLAEHAGHVSAIDWCAKTNMIVTSGHDRNAYVWKYEEKTGDWKPELVILRINRAATSVQWSPNGDKFAVTSGAKCVPVCHFEESNNWWISKMIKKHKSTVLCLDWCKNNKFIVTGATDFKCRIFSAFISGIDEDCDDGYGDIFPKQNNFGECLAEYDHAKAWINSVAWAPSGFGISFAGHGSTLHRVDLKTKEVNTTYCKSLPYNNVGYLDDDTLLAVGFDQNPTVYKNNSGSWEMSKKLDPEKEEEKKAAKKGAFGAAFNKFKTADSHGSQFGKGKAVVESKTFHKNTITDVHFFRNEDGTATEFSTSGIDGRLLMWKI